ncbi:MAG: hypothetical protein Q9M82_01535 [Mariprofundus sp.]|nr:hypothetical protein [Mariprofundus sp.]
MKFFGLLVLALLLYLPACYADSASAYRQAVDLAAQGDDRAALASWRALADALPAQDFWQQRMLAAGQLMSMRMAHQSLFSAQSGPNQYLALASSYAAAHPLLQDATRWPATALAVIIPGAGHAWQGRWKDAGMAALMVFPMLILTLWAARRRMGPVTVFFALITLWFWSGTVFSSMSLAERASAEMYMAWWQGIWQASGLPGRPW